MNQGSSKGSSLLKTDDYWAIWLGMIVIALSVGFFWAGSTLKPWAVTPGTWSDSGHLTADPVLRVFGLTTIPRIYRNECFVVALRAKPSLSNGGIRGRETVDPNRVNEMLCL